MANTPVRDDIVPPTFARTFTTFGADRTLHADSTNGGSAPAGINHLPCALFVIAQADDVLEFYDSSGTVNTITFTTPSTFVGTMRCAPTVLGDATTCVSVTVFWHPEP